AVGSADAMEIADGATVIEGSGRYLSPGLVEMHAHVPEARRGRQYLEDVLYLWVANGVTTVRNMAGEAAHLQLREEIARGDVIGPRLYTSGPRFAGKRIGDAPERVAAQKEAGYDFLKVHMGLTGPIYDEITTAAAANDMVVAGHVAEEVGLWRALEARQKSIDHLDAYFKAMAVDDADLGGVKDQLLGFAYLPFLDHAKFDVVSDATAAAGVWNVPTLTLAVNFIGPYEAAGYPELQFMPANVASSWEKIVMGYQATLEDPELAQEFLRSRDKLVRALHDAGAGLLLGSDTPQMLNVPGFALHKELALMIAAGLTPAEALTTGTVNPAIYLDAEDTFGRVAEGLAADLVLTDANPLEQPDTLGEPVGVMLRGRWMSREELRAGLAAIVERNRPEKN
ncbi:MAG: amidohydrolase family protein, partial [Gammaproteobacteria bacterium]|nr:amidohydrolase family protein [Gammaproteobacteria bacterium]